MAKGQLPQGHHADPVQRPCPHHTWGGWGELATGGRSWVILKNIPQAQRKFSCCERFSTFSSRRAAGEAACGHDPEGCPVAAGRGRTGSVCLFPPQGSEKGAARPTAFKPVLPRSGALLHSSPESASHQLHPAPPDKPREQELKPGLCSGALSDSGRNSMSSLPTHSTSSSYQLDPLVPAVGPASRFGGSAHNITQGILLQDSNMMSLKALSFSDGGSKLAHPGKADRGSACVRSPIPTDEGAIQELEQKLLEREGELQRLRRSFEEKEPASGQAYEERPWRCKEEAEGAEQKGGGKPRPASQKRARTQQALHLQVLQLQQEKRQLRQELDSLMKEQDLLETRLRSYEKEKTSFGPALEETQWEVRPWAGWSERWGGGGGGGRCLVPAPPLLQVLASGVRRRAAPARWAKGLAL